MSGYRSDIKTGIYWKMEDNINNCDALHIIYPATIRHIPSGQCPCGPELIWESTVNGKEIWRHVREV